MQLSGAEPAAVRQVHFHDPAAPRASAVVPSVFVVARDAGGRLLLVRRCDDGTWELPGGQVEVGEDAVATAVRETAEETGIGVRVTGLVGLYTDPGHVVRSVSGQVRQQFVVVLHADVGSGEPHPDHEETAATGWFSPDEALRLPLREPVWRWVADALAGGPPRLA